MVFAYDVEIRGLTSSNWAWKRITNGYWNVTNSNYATKYNENITQLEDAFV